MFRKKNRRKKNSRAMLSAYSIIMILIILLGIMSHVLPSAKFTVAPPEEDEASVEVGPGEWEGEEPTGGPAELNGEVPAKPDEDVLPEDESFTPEVGDEVETKNLPQEQKTINNDEKSNHSDEVEAAVVEEDADGTIVASGEEMVAASVTEDENKSEEAPVYDSKEACEEENGEDACVVVDGSGVVGAELYQVLIAPILGFQDAIDVCIFVMVLGGFLAVMAKTKALETGIKILVKKLHGKEYILILLLMFIFSILGTTYGFLEESV